MNILKIRYFYQILFILFISLPLVGCGSAIKSGNSKLYNRGYKASIIKNPKSTNQYHTKMPKFSLKNPEHKNKSILITRVKNIFGVTITRFNTDPNQNTYVYHMTEPGIIFLDKGFERSFYALDPGIYYISSAYFDGGLIRHYITKGITDEQTIMYGAFEIKPNEVAYLGELVFHLEDSKAQDLITVKADFEDAKRKLLKSNPQHAHIISKMKQIKFHKPGSKIFVEDDVIYIN